MTTSMRLLVVTVLAAGVASGQVDGVPGTYRLSVTRATIPSSISIVEAKTDITFADPIPANGMDPDYIGRVSSADVYQDTPHPGVAHIVLESNNIIFWMWSFGSNLQSGSAALPTSFGIRYKGFWEVGGRTGGKVFKYYSGNPLFPPAYQIAESVAGNARTDYSGPGPTKVPLDLVDPRVEVWLRAIATRNGRNDPPGTYSQVKRYLGVTFTMIP